jgi:hypothetical protein
MGLIPYLECRWAPAMGTESRKPHSRTQQARTRERTTQQHTQRERNMVTNMLHSKQGFIYGTKLAEMNRMEVDGD